ELVSNAVDASQKLKTLSGKGEVKGAIGDLRVDVVLDAKEKTLSIIDNGIGMSSAEVDKYINQVAFSGAEEFVNKYKDASIIGHFGLGFYSSFMVSDKVDIYSKSHTDAPGVFWSCDGSTEYELYEVDYSARGTKIVLHINEESAEFLDPHRIKSILERFCKFLPVAIYFTDANAEKKEVVKEEGKAEEIEVEKSINNTNPIWVRKPSELTKEDYEKFYKELYPFSETPLFWIHLNVDYPFNLTGVLYFPKIKQSFEIQKDKIQLYCNQVFVTDEVKDIVPEFLMLLHGVIDSPDIPLNVSRSYLQGDPNVKKINAHITKKVADKLEEIFNSDRKSFEEKWESLGLFVKYGMITDDKFLEKANKFLIMEDAASAGTFYTLDEYKTATAATQKNKEGKQVLLYTTNPVQQDAFVQAAVAKGFKVVKLETMVDAAFIN
ncbi:MAG: molecular chaperone HtpG, partial [Sediminibacterium sp.]